MIDSSAIALVVHEVSKRFPPAVQALDRVSLELRAGEVHALIGENGAGKSTLSRIIAGIEQADGGSIRFRGRAIQPRSRREAEALGIRMVMQELNLVPTLTVAENIFLDRIPKLRMGFGMIDRAALRQRTAELLGRVGLASLDPESLIGELGIAEQQLVEIARGLSVRCDVLILDEPTAALTSPEAELLFSQIDALTRNGVAVLYISHRLEEIARLARRITVLRDGAVVGTVASGEATVSELIRMMVGRSVAGTELRSRARGEVALRVENLCTRSGVRKVSFELRRGEILGLAGLMGAGRTETVRAIFGADRIESGTISLGEGAPVRFNAPSEAVRAGLALATEDRKGQGLLMPASVRENISLAAMDKVRGALGFITRGTERARTGEMTERLKVRASSVEQPVRQLSGGNQQKVVIAKWLFRDPSILIFDEPTRGIDVGAKFEIYELLVALAEQGKAILVVSSELTELLLICNRIAVLSKGKLVRTFDAAEFDPNAIMAAALSEHRQAENA